jgi:hypothetical protein
MIVRPASIRASLFSLELKSWSTKSSSSRMLRANKDLPGCSARNLQAL